MAFELYHYKPSLAAAILFLVMFTMTTSLHIYQVIRTRTWFFIAFCCGGLCETIGYIFRILSASQSPNNYTLGPYIGQSVLLLVAPALFAASIYMSLGRIVELVDGDKFLFVRRRWLTSVFVLGDILSFLMQGSGGGLMSSSSPDSRREGSNIIVGGLFLQISFFGLFVITALLFHYRLSKNPTPRAFSVPYRKHLVALYATSILIFLRSIVRVVEFLQGFEGYIIEHEVFLYVFDGVPMLIAMLIFNWIHPSEVKSLLRGGKAANGFRMVDTAA